MLKIGIFLGPQCDSSRPETIRDVKKAYRYISRRRRGCHGRHGREIRPWRVPRRSTERRMRRVPRVPPAVSNRPAANRDGA